MSEFEKIIQAYPSRVELPVVWGEMDAALHVNNTVYLRYSESGRIALFRQLGFEVDVNNEENPVGPILAEINCRYKMPLTYPDTVTVATRPDLSSLDDHSFWMEQVIVSHNKARVAAEVRTRLVSYDYIALKKAPLPETLKAQLKSLGN